MTEIRQMTGTARETTGVIDRIAIQQLTKRLQKLPKGELVIDDGDKTIRLGSDRRNNICARIDIHDKSAFRDIAFGGSLGAAEAYMQGKWTSPDLVQLVRLMSINIDFLNEIDDSKKWLRGPVDKIYHWLRRNTLTGSRKNIAAHYDLSNAFFSLFLDSSMMYSAAIFESGESELDHAAELKLDIVCRKLELKATDHLLEIGTGWGGMAIYAAQKFGCRVTTTTISKQQYNSACEKVKQLGLEDQITVLFEDYRNLEGRFDKLVSIEMIEAVGHEYYGDYFNVCSSLLKPDGLMLLQAITIPAQRYQYALKSVDFIQRYIFPGGSLPSHEIILNSMKNNSDMEMIGMQEIGRHYAKTLDVWRQRYLNRLDRVHQLGFDKLFIRMWHYYLCYCQGAFEERIIGTSQMLLAKPGWRESGN